MITETNFKGAIVEMLTKAETELPRDVLIALRKAAKSEDGKIAKINYETMLKNLDLAKKSKAPICQDTGTFTFFIKLGRELKLQFDITKATTEAVKTATLNVPLRANVVDPLTRAPSLTNTGKEQPALHVEITEGKELQVDLLVKGAGTENCGRLFMAQPADGPDVVVRVVRSVLEEVRGRPCPPNIVGVGIGGSIETAALMAKRVLLRPLDKPNPDLELASLERKIEEAANRLGTGPMGLGGKTTLLRVLVEKASCHTASLPIAVALQCWPARRAKAKILGGKLKVVEP